MTTQQSYKDRQFLAVIGDEDSVTGMLLAGIGHITSSNATADLSLSSSNPTVAVADLNPTADARTGAGANGSTKNFLIVDSKTSLADIENAFEEFTAVRRDIGIVLINQHIAERIRYRVDTYTAAFPAVLEIPSKDHPYDPDKDSVLRRVRRLFGE